MMGNMTSLESADLPVKFTHRNGPLNYVTLNLVFLLASLHTLKNFKEVGDVGSSKFYVHLVY
jgi:hypothetical protein